MPTRTAAILPKPGDLALVRSDAVGSKLIVRAQKRIRGAASFSHAILNVSGRLWCDAVPGRGVSLITTSETGIGHKGVTYQIFRPPTELEKPIRGTSASERVQHVFDWIDSEVNERREWIDLAAAYIGQKYNYSILIPKLRSRDTTKFCTELIAGIYQLRGVQPFCDSRPTRILPADLESIINESIAAASGWTNITEGFSAYLALIARNPDRTFSEDDERKIFLNAYEANTQTRLLSITQLRIQLQTAELSYTTLSKLGAASGHLEHSREQLEKSVAKAKASLVSLRSLDVFFKSAAPYLLGADLKRLVGSHRRNLEKTVRTAGRALKR